MAERLKLAEQENRALKAENAQLRKEREILEGAAAFFRQSPEEVGKDLRFEYVSHHAEPNEIATYCRVLEVSPQGYKKYLLAQQKPYKYAHLLADMGAILEEDTFNQTYGKQRMYEKLQLDFDCVKREAYFEKLLDQAA